MGEENSNSLIGTSSEKIIKGDIFYEVKVFLFNKDDFITIKITNKLFIRKRL